MTLSIICVYNDPDVRAACLDASIDRHRGEVLDIDYVPVDNTEHQFASAGAALNHGASLARHEHLVFVHQDVVIHSLSALVEAAQHLDDERIALIGAFGVTGHRRFVGRIRDRILLTGDHVAEPVDVDSVDEVLFMACRDRILAEPLSTHSDLSWHGYAVEYGMRGRAAGDRVTAVDMPITHNSLTINLDRLTNAHEHLARTYPTQLPVLTTCGTIGAEPTPPGRLSAHRWRYRWFRNSARLWTARRSGRARFVISDIRLDLDEALSTAPTHALEVLNLDHCGEFVDEADLELQRLGRTLRVRSVSLDEMAEAIRERDEASSLLCTNLTTVDLRDLRALTPAGPSTIGVHDDTGFWLLAGPVAEAKIDEWDTARSKPMLLAG